MTAATSSVEERAVASAGRSSDAIHRMVERAISRDDVPNAVVIDVGCGQGDLYRTLGGRVGRYIGMDVVRFDDFPADAELRLVDVDSARLPADDETADIVIAIETIEHLENPRAFVRELVRIAKPGGRIVITTPNQQSILSIATLCAKGHYSAFQGSNYPAHITALLEMDLARIAGENGLTDVRFDYSRRGRIALTSKHVPAWMANLAPRAFSDNLMLTARKAR